MKYHICPNCDGNGFLTRETDIMTCIVCDGAGEIEADNETMFSLLRWGVITGIVLIVPSLLLEVCK